MSVSVSVKRLAAGVKMPSKIMAQHCHAKSFLSWLTSLLRPEINPSESNEKTRQMAIPGC
jgi:hypothetical protein